jgi:hypothetical protein
MSMIQTIHLQRGRPIFERDIDEMKGGRLHYFHRVGLNDVLLKMSVDLLDACSITLTGCK